MDEKHPSVPYGYCECGCGQKTRIAQWTNRACADIAGEPRRFLKGHHGRGKISNPTENRSTLDGTAYCQCGCGASLAGRFVTTRYHSYQHGIEAALQRQGHKPRPERTCPCGCGRQPKLGSVWIKGHGTRISGQDYCVEPETGCWIWQRSISADGYPGSARDAAGKQMRGYRMVYERERGLIPEGMHLHHICKRPACVNPDHLRPVTPREHVRLHGRLKLTPAVLSEARRLLNCGLSQREVARRLNASRRHLMRVLDASG